MIRFGSPVRLIQCWGAALPSDPMRRVGPLCQPSDCLLKCVLRCRITVSLSVACSVRQLMVRRTFFSFHYERDVSRAMVVRNSWMTKPDRDSAGFFDGSLWEEAGSKPDAVSQAINEGLARSSVTVVLIGAETANRAWVIEEIRRSLELRKGLLGIHVNRIPNLLGFQDPAGENPFAKFTVIKDGELVPLSNAVKTYLWQAHDGYANLGDWIEEADRLSQLFVPV